MHLWPPVPFRSYSPFRLAFFPLRKDGVTPRLDLGKIQTHSESVVCVRAYGRSYGRTETRTPWLFWFCCRLALVEREGIFAVVFGLWANDPEEKSAQECLHQDQNHGL